MSGWEPQVGDRVEVVVNPDCRRCKLDASLGLTGTVGYVRKRPKTKGTKGHRFWVEYLFWVPLPGGGHMLWGFYRAAELRPSVPP